MESGGRQACQETTSTIPILGEPGLVKVHKAKQICPILTQSLYHNSIPRVKSLNLEDTRATEFFKVSYVE